MTRSPISSPDILDKSPVPTTAIARATDEVLWAVVKLLIEKKNFSSDELVIKLRPVLDEIQVSRPLADQEAEDRFATSLAIERVVDALKDLS